jgi:hypothetical protein
MSKMTFATIVVMVLVLVACSGSPSSSNPPQTPNPFADFGCTETPQTTTAKVINNAELGKVYEFQGGKYALQLELTDATRLRLTLTEVEAYDTLWLWMTDYQSSKTLFHNPGDPSGNGGSPLQTATLETDERFQGFVTVQLTRAFNDVTLSTDAGKRLFCQRYKAVLEAVF